MRPSMHTMIHAAAFALAGCTGTQPLPYPGPLSSAQLQPDATDIAGQMLYSHSERIDWRAYSNILIEPIEIYRGSDSQFEDVTEEDREALAQYMDARFSDRLNARFSLVTRTGPDTLRLKLTLTGATASTPMIGTFTRFDLAGGPYNLVQALRGKEGLFTGSVTYAVEIFDASTDRLLMAYVARQYPNAWNIKATFGKLDASRAGIDKAADDLAARLTRSPTDREVTENNHE